MSYTHLNSEERYYIYIELKKGTSHTDIAKALGRSQPSISREIKRNTGGKGYRHKQAEELAKARSKAKKKSVKLNDSVKELIVSYLKEDWSPEQIAGRLKRDKIVTLHHETIYQYILSDKQNGGLLYKHLRHQGKPYRKRYGSPRNRTGIPNRVDIDERPVVADLRQRVGDWEADTIIGKAHQGAIVTLDERKTKLRLAAPLPSKQSQLVAETTINLLGPISDFVKTVTFDNGKEFTAHESIASELDCKTYFAKPYHSWERGQNENANGLLRQYFPKSEVLNNIDDGDVFHAVHKLNSRPRKCLGFLTPYEKFKRLTGVDVEKVLGYALMTRM